jgi:hypothetical protein
MTTGRKCYGFAGGNHQSVVDQAHHHDAVQHGHFVNFDVSGQCSQGGQQFVRCDATILNRQISSATCAPFGVARLQACLTLMSPADACAWKPPITQRRQAWRATI